MSWRDQLGAGSASGHPQPNNLPKALARWLTLPFQLVAAGFEIMLHGMNEAGRVASGRGESLFRSLVPAGDPARGDAISSRDPFAQSHTAEAGVEVNERPTTEEENSMSHADRDLSGTDLKIVEYTIATSAPYIPDKDRILTDCPKVIAISEDLSESAFVAMVVADNCKYIDKEECDEKWDPRYLLVSYNVLARQSIDTVYERDQVKALRDIKDILEKNPDDNGKK